MDIIFSVTFRFEIGQVSNPLAQNHVLVYMKILDINHIYRVHSSHLVLYHF